MATEATTTRHPDQLVPDRYVADAYGINVKTAQRWADAGRIPRPVVRRPKFTRWSKNEVDADVRKMIEDQRKEAAA